MYIFYKKNKIIKFFRGLLVFLIIFSWSFSPIVPVLNLPFSDEKIRLGFEVKNAEAVFGNGYTYRRSITIQNGQVIGLSNHSNFPVLMSFSEATLREDTSGGNVTDLQGDDIIFTSDAAGDTQLDHEVESYSPTTGGMTMWVEVPTLDFDDDTVVYMFYGNSSVTTPTEDVTGTWDTTYDGVWHMHDSGSTNTDSAGSANDGTVSGATAGAAGKFGPAYDFDGVNDVSTVTDANPLDLVNTGTIEAWIKTDDVTTTASQNTLWQVFATSTLGISGTDDYSNIDSVIVGEKIYYGAVLCRETGETFYTATSTLDGINRSIWTARATTTGATIGQCQGTGGLSIGVDSDGKEIWYAVYGQDGASAAAETFAYSTSTLSLTTFSNWKQPATAPNGASGAENSPIDMTITGNQAYFAVTAVSGTTMNLFTSSINLDGSGWSGWTDGADQPAGSGAGEGCGLGLDTEGTILYFDSVCQANATEVHEWSISKLDLTQLRTFQGGADPDGADTSDWHGNDSTIVGGTSYKVFYGHAASVTSYRIASSTLEGDVPASNWASIKAASGDPDGTNTVDTTDPSIESDGKDLFYSAFAHDTTRTSFFIASTTLPAHPFVSKRNAYEMIQSGTGFVFDWVGKPTTFGTTTAVSTFYHIAVTQSGSIMSYYINGALYGSTTVSTDFESNANNLLIGAGTRSNGSSIYFNGVIDEVRISSSTRSVDWIQTGYNNQNSTSTFYNLGGQEEASVIPTVTTNFANAGFNFATLSGTKTSGTDATEHGFAYGTNSGLSDGFDTATTTLGALASNSSFTNNVGSLSAGITYFFRAYATNAAGTGLGIIKSFVTGNSTAKRAMRLFQGFRVKFLNGRVILNQQP